MLFIIKAPLLILEGIPSYLDGSKLVLWGTYQVANRPFSLISSTNAAGTTANFLAYVTNVMLDFYTVQ